MPENKTIQLHFLVSEQEKELIINNMKRAGINGIGAYLRKMAINGYIVNLDLSDVNKLTSLLSNATNNLNQIARRVNETGNIYKEDIHDLQENYDKLWDKTKDILFELSKL